MTNLTRQERVLRWVTDEIIRAEELHPGFPKDPLYRMGIVTEECGEAMKEAIDLVLKGDESARNRLRDELIQTAAMAVRSLLEMEAEWAAHCA